MLKSEDPAVVAWGETMRQADVSQTDVQRLLAAAIDASNDLARAAFAALTARPIIEQPIERSIWYELAYEMWELVCNAAPLEKPKQWREKKADLSRRLAEAIGGP